MTIPSSDSPVPGNQIRALGDRLLASVQGRIDLISIELQEEKFRLIQSFIWISLAVFTAMLAITFASMALVYSFDESERHLVLAGLTALYVVAFIVTVIAFRNYLVHQPRPFAATLEELEKDRACIPDKS